VRKDSDTGAFRKGLMEEFQIWLQKKKTEPNLERSLTLGLQSWIYDVMGREPSGSTFQKWELAVTTQVNLGWCAFLCGFVSKPLIDMQHDHYFELQLKKKAERWAIKLIHKSWKIMYQLWTQRNTALHETDAIHKNSGVALTDVFLCGKLQRIVYLFFSIGIDVESTDSHELDLLLSMLSPKILDRTTPTQRK
jgi:hypothetical protein